MRGLISEIKIGEYCTERQKLLDSLLECDDAFALTEDELGETDILLTQKMQSQSEKHQGGCPMP